MSARDIVVLALVIGSFAVLVTAHVVIVAGLAARSPRWRALLALVIAPLAPYYAFRARMPFRATVWLAGLVLYAVARALAMT